MSLKSSIGLSVVCPASNGEQAVLHYWRAVLVRRAGDISL